MGSIISNKWNTVENFKICPYFVCVPPSLPPPLLPSPPLPSLPLPSPPLPSLTPIKYCTVLNNAYSFVIKDRYICPVVSNSEKLHNDWYQYWEVSMQVNQTVIRKSGISTPLLLSPLSYMQ